MSQTKPKLKPPMPSRDSAGHFELKNPDDGTAIKEMFEHGGALLMITEKCTYRMQVADQIDPERTNPALPHNVTQKIFDHGTTSELLCNTLLLAKVMFRKEFLKIDIERAKQLALDAFSELVAMQEAAGAFVSAEQAAIEKAQRTPQQPRSWALPSVSNVRTHCKTVMQKADHCAGALMQIVRLFYPEANNPNWDEFYEIVKTRYGVTDSFCAVMASATPFLRLVRNARDCLEHPIPGAVVRDFEVLPDGTLAPPTIEINFRQSTLKRCSIASFMEEAQKSLLNVFEMIVVHMCSKNVQSFAGLPIIVDLLPENYRAAWHVRFAYGMIYQDGKFAPIG